MKDCWILIWWVSIAWTTSLRNLQPSVKCLSSQTITRDRNPTVDLFSSHPRCSETLIDSLIQNRIWNRSSSLIISWYSSDKKEQTCFKISSWKTHIKILVSTRGTRASTEVLRSPITKCRRSILQLIIKTFPTTSKSRKVTLPTPREYSVKVPIMAVGYSEIQKDTYSPNQAAMTRSRT